MGSSAAALPHWTWDDLETAFELIGSGRREKALREHLIRQLKQESARATPAELLASLMNTAVLVAQTPSAAIDLPREDRSFG